MAGVTNVTAAARTALLTGNTIREFLKANGVDAAGGSTDATVSVVRVICGRKQAAYGIARSWQQGIDGFEENNIMRCVHD